MDPIIRSAPVAVTTRQLRRPAAAQPPAVARETVSHGPVGQVAPVQPARPVTPAVARDREAPAPAMPAGPSTAMPARGVQAAATPATLAAPASPSTGQPPSAGVQQDAPPPDAWEALRKREQALQESEQALHARVAEQDERERHHTQAAEDLLSESRERGYQEGRAQALQELEAQREQAAGELTRQAEEIKQVLDGLRSARADLLEQSCDMLVEIVHAAICRLLGEHGATRAVIEATVQVALREARDSEQLRVRVHPQDLDLLRSLYGGADSRIGLQSDMAVELGGCLVETAHGTLDARLELQLQNLRKALMEARHARSSIEVAD